ncbi:MAG: hypothetical protein JWQ07_2582 [Ramlibacter sp.]|nr:hypothetical protein [Ramlibacter sp.]
MRGQAGWRACRASAPCQLRISRTTALGVPTPGRQRRGWLASSVATANSSIATAQPPATPANWWVFKPRCRTGNARLCFRTASLASARRDRRKRGGWLHRGDGAVRGCPRGHASSSGVDAVAQAHQKQPPARCGVDTMRTPGALAHPGRVAPAPCTALRQAQGERFSRPGSRSNVTTWSTSARMPIHSPILWSWWLGTWASTVSPLFRRSV